MKKIKISGLVLLGALALGAFLSGDKKAAASINSPGSELFGGSDAMFQTNVSATGTKVFDGPGTLYRIELSTNITGAVLDYVQVIDTWTTVGACYECLANANKATPAIIFNGTSTVNGQGQFKDFTPYGIKITSGMYVYKTSANNGEAIRANVYWRR